MLGQVAVYLSSIRRSGPRNADAPGDNCEDARAEGVCSRG